MANSMPVVIASDQSAVPISDNGGSITVDGTVTANQGGTWNINNISGTISLPTGAATETTLSALNGKVTACNTGAVTIAALPNEGQQTMANSISVAIASDQTALTISPAACVGAAPTFATVGVTSASTGIAAGTYVKLMFCNTSINTIALGFNNTAVTNRGIVLRAGEKFVLDGPITVTSVNAIASAASSNLAIQAFT
jgi:hypothetical protein